MQKNFLFDYHIQTLDHGKNMPFRIEETIEAAISSGLSAICLTDHYPLPPSFIDPTAERDCVMPLSKYQSYRKKIAKAQKEYSSRINILVGAEFDWLPDYQQWTARQIKRWPFDYLIGSVHFLGQISDAKGKRNFLIDYTKEEFDCGIAFYQGIKNLIRAYYSQLDSMIQSDLFDGVGHFDLVKKFNNGSLFDEKESWYQDVVKQTLDLLASSKMVLEINTSGLSQKCQTVYPSFWILTEARKRKIPLTIGSDAHQPAQVGQNLQFAVALAKRAGYDAINRFVNRQKIEVPI